VDLVEDAIAGAEDFSQSEVRFTYSRPEQRLRDRLLVRAVERASGQAELERLYRAWATAPATGENFFAAALRLLRIEVETDAAGWAKVPASGPVLFVANHPFGVVDGLMLGRLALAARPDMKIITHSLLCQVRQARDNLLPVDFGGTPEAQATTLRTRRRAIGHLAAGGAVGVFPAGSVSTAARPWTGPALEPAWHPFVARLARVPGLVAVPVYFHGQNSRLFQIVSHFSYPLRIALLFRETRRLMGSTIRVSIGEPVPARALEGEGRQGIVGNMRAMTHALGGGDAGEFRWPVHIRFL